MSVTNHEPLRLGVIGLGRHGSRYVRHLLADVPEARLAAVCRRNLSAGSGVPAGVEVACYQEYRSLIADPRVDAVVIVTPPVLNREICLAAIGASKPFLVEKPLAVTVEDAQAIVSAAAQVSLPAMMAQTLRFDSAIQAAMAQRSSLGDLRYLCVASRMEPSGGEVAGFDGRGCLLEIGVHALDLIRLITDDEVERLSCEMDLVPPEGAERLVMGRLVTRGGIPCQFDVSRVSSGRVGRLDLIGSQGQLTVDWCGHRLVRRAAGLAPIDEPTGADPTLIATLRAFVQAVRTGTPPPITLDDGLRAVAVADACYRSARQGGRPVHLT